MSLDAKGAAALARRFGLGSRAGAANASDPRGALLAGFADLLRCPRCGAHNTLADEGGAVKCGACQAEVRKRGEILDFVDGATDTQLDVSAYDQEKRVSYDASLTYLRRLQSIAGDVLASDLGNYLEVGAGTGLLTMAVLKELPFTRAVITDVSPKMLSLCRERLHDKDRTLFVTYDSELSIFAPGAFDTCIANSVLHHVADYQRLLGGIGAALKPGGAFLCVEPTALFHDALSRAMADAVCELAARSAAGPNQLRRISAIVWDIRARFVLAKDPAIRTLEDKHLFTRDALNAAAKEAGFESLTILPYFVDPNGAGGVRDYLGEVNVSAEFSNLFAETFAKYAPYYFDAMAEDDMTLMYVCVFRR